MIKCIEVPPPAGATNVDAGWAEVCTTLSFEIDEASREMVEVRRSYWLGEPNWPLKVTGAVLRDAAKVAGVPEGGDWTNALSAILPWSMEVVRCFDWRRDIFIARRIDLKNSHES